MRQGINRRSQGPERALDSYFQGDSTYWSRDHDTHLGTESPSSPLMDTETEFDKVKNAHSAENWSVLNGNTSESIFPQFC